MSGKGNVFTGAGSSTAVIGGISVLPNTNGNTALILLSAATIAIGGMILLSFVFTRVVTRFYS